jgi:hypothetical protein
VLIDAAGMSAEKAAAIAGLTTLGLDPAELVMTVTSDVAWASRPQRLDLNTNELVDEVIDPRIG